MSEEYTGSLAKALAKAQSEFKDIKRDKTANVKMKTGGTFSYSYVSLANIIDATQPALHKNGLAVTQVFDEKDGATSLCTHLFHESGESITSTMPIRQDADPQKFGSLITYYRRYALCAILNIMADDDDDGARASQNSHENAVRSQPNTQGGGKGTKQVTGPQIKRLAAIMNNRGWSPEQTKHVIAEKFELESSKDLTMTQYDALVDIIEAYDFASWKQGVDEKTQYESDMPPWPGETFGG